MPVHRRSSVSETVKPGELRSRKGASSLGGERALDKGRRRQDCASSTYLHTYVVGAATTPNVPSTPLSNHRRVCLPRCYLDLDIGNEFPSFTPRTNKCICVNSIGHIEVERAGGIVRPQPRSYRSTPRYISVHRHVLSAVLGTATRYSTAQIGRMINQSHSGNFEGSSVTY